MKSKTISNPNPWDDFKAISSDPFPPNYLPQTVEIFDQMGLLIGMVNGQVSYESTRPSKYEPSYIAWYLDGQLGFFSLGNSVLLNRLGLVAVSEIIKEGTE